MIGWKCAEGPEESIADSIPVFDLFVHGIHDNAVLFCDFRNQYKRNVF